MYREEPLLAHPPPDATLWRYMDFTKFVSILEKDALFFPRADKLGDPYEGFLPERVLETLRKSFANQADPRSNIYWNITQAFRTICAFTLISCWHESTDESAAMWRCYAESNNGIAIKTTFGSLCQSLICEPDVFIGRVSYIDYESPAPVGVLDEDDPLFHMKNGDHPLRLRSQFFKKRKAFFYEQEVRALCSLSLDGLFAGGMTKEIPEPSCGIGMPLEINLHHLAHEFVVSPFAVDSFFELVSALLQRYQVDIPVRHSSIRGNPLWS